MLTYKIEVGPHAGQTTTNVEQFIRWLKAEPGVVSPELEASIRGEEDMACMIDAMAAKFEDRE